ncbi:hypothetical protein B0H16DRAFT_1469502 [Mycena metata]|uniref:Uncharacterized protein n=1 Tax=Mycena metata TaxID=1033252 RepID=A0AAD7HXP1_9AGAR|nr:hypothetical protein B0H16DRAFT_1469502 [Mycena metata]
MGSWWTVTEFSGIGAPLVKIWDSMLINKLRAHPRAVLEVDGSSVTHEPTPLTWASTPQAALEGEDELEEEEADRGAGTGKPCPLSRCWSPVLGKRKRLAKDEGEGRELVGGAADNVLTTMRARRTESEAAWQKREVLWRSWINGERWSSTYIGGGQSKRLKQNVKRKKSFFFFDKVDVGMSGVGTASGGVGMMCGSGAALPSYSGAASAATMAAATGDEEGGEGGGVGGDLRGGSGHHPP